MDERKASTKTHRCSCHGKIRFDSFQVDLLVGWLRTRPSATWNGQQQEGSDPGGSGGEPEAELRLALRCRRHDLVGRVDGDERDDRAKDQGAPAGQSERARGAIRRSDGSESVSADMCSPVMIGMGHLPLRVTIERRRFQVTRSRPPRPRRRRWRPRRPASRRRPSATGPSGALRAAARPRPRTGRTPRRRPGGPRAPRPGS